MAEQDHARFPWCKPRQHTILDTEPRPCAVSHADPEAFQLKLEGFRITLLKVIRIHIAVDRLDRRETLQISQHAPFHHITAVQDKIGFGADLIDPAGQGAQPGRYVRIRENRYLQSDFLLLVPVRPSAFLTFVGRNLLALALFSVWHLLRNLVLYKPGWLENRNLTTRNRHGAPCMRVPGDTPPAVDDLEGAKAPYFNVLMSIESFPQFLEEAVYDQRNILLVQIDVVACCDFRNEISFCHLVPPTGPGL
jgi:hypothetical protein